MSQFHIAFTAPANPSNDSTQLSVDDLWQGCVLLAELPELFTSSVASCDIQSKQGGRMLRTLKFRDEALPPMRQEVVLKEKHKFESTTLGTENRVTTVIFRGLSGESEDLYLSLEYSIPYNQVDPNGVEGKNLRAAYTTKAKQNLREGLDSMRRLKADGRLY